MSSHARRMTMGVIVCVVLGGSALAHAGEKKTIDTRSLTAIEVRLITGVVELMAWNGEQATVEYLNRSLPVTVDKGILKIGAANEKDPTMSDRLKILAPPKLLVTVLVDSAAVNVQGFSGRIQIQTMGGNVEVSACSAPVTIETAGGNIQVQDIKGDISLKTVNGQIGGRNLQAAFLETKSVSGSQELVDVAARQLRIRSHSGLIDVRGKVPDDGFWEASSFDGSLDFTFDEPATIDLEAHARTGLVRVDESIAPREKAGNYFRGQIGSGKALVRLTSFQGQIEVGISAP